MIKGGYLQYLEELKARENKTAITPNVIIITPAGITSFVEADVFAMSYQEMAALIDADRLDAVHFSDTLNEITQICKLTKQVTMYVDRNGLAKNLADNTVASILYGGAHEIRGSIIIAMEDDKYDTHSFDTKEDIENVYNAIVSFTGGLARKM